MPNKTRFLMTIYELMLQWQGKEDCFFFTSDECGLTNRVFLHFRLSDLSARSTQTLFSRCAAHLFIYCRLHVTCYSYMYHVTETNFSVFYVYYYCLPESEK